MKTNIEVTAFRHKIIDNYKVSIGCEICGYNKHPSALCFDHLGVEEKAEITKNGCSKRSCAGGMYRLYHKNYSSQELLNEIKKCRILCANCHMELTHSKNTRTASNLEHRLTFQDLEDKLNKFDNTEERHVK